MLIARDQQCHGHAEHTPAQQAQRPLPFPAIAGEASRHPDVAAHALDREIDDRDIDRRVGAEEREVPVRRRPLRAVCIQIDLRQRVHEAPHAGAEEVAERLCDQPGQRRVIAALESVLTGIVYGVHDHRDERYRLERGEKATDAQPVFGSADPEIVMAEAQDARTEHHRDLDVQPGRDDLPADAERLDQAPRHDAADQHLPGRLDPQMHDPPPPVLIHGHIRREEHAREVHAGERDEVEHQHARDAAPPTLHEGRGNVVEEDEYAHDDADIGPARRLYILPPLVDKPDRLPVARADLDQQEHHDDDGHGGDQDPEIQQRELRAHEFRSGFVFYEPVDGSDETEQHPDDHGVNVHHARHVEVQLVVEQIRKQELQTCNHSEYDLREEQYHRRYEVMHRDPLAGVQI